VAIIVLSPGEQSDDERHKQKQHDAVGHGAIVMETGMGNYDRAMAYGIVLRLLVALVVGLLSWAQQNDGPR